MSRDELLISPANDFEGDGLSDCHFFGDIKPLFTGVDIAVSTSLSKCVNLFSLGLQYLVDACLLGKFGEMTTSLSQSKM